MMMYEWSELTGGRLYDYRAGGVRVRNTVPWQCNTISIQFVLNDHDGQTDWRYFHIIKVQAHIAELSFKS